MTQNSEERNTTSSAEERELKRDLLRSREMFERHRKRYALHIRLQMAFTFLVLVAGVGIGVTVFNARPSIESQTLRTVVAVISGILGLLVGVGTTNLVAARLRRQNVEELREFEKALLDRIKRDLSARLTAKVK